MIQNIFPTFSARVAVAIIFSSLSPLRCRLQRRDRGRYSSRISVVLMSAFERYFRDLSIDYFNLPKIGGVYEISGKEREGPSSLLLKGPHIHT